MNRRAVTLLELILALILSSILGLVLTAQFVAMASFQQVLEDRLEATREARIVTNHMAKYLMFAHSGQNSIIFTRGAQTDVLQAAVEGGHLDRIPWPDADNPVIYYTRFKTGPNAGLLRFVVETDDGEQIRQDVSRDMAVDVAEDVFNAVWYHDNNLLFLQVTTRRNNAEVRVRTTIRTLGSE